VEGRLNLFKALDAEWAIIGTGWRAEQRLVEWKRQEPDLAGCRSPADVVARCHRRGDTEGSNQLMSALLRLAATDHAAARAVLQALLPALAGLVRRCRVGAGAPWADQTQLDQDAIANAWERIMAAAGDPPPWPAMTIVNATWERLRTAVEQNQYRKAALVGLGAANALEVPDEESPIDRIVLALGDALAAGALDNDAAGLILRTRVFGLSPAEEAAASGRTPHAVYKNRERAERALAVHTQLRLAQAS